MDVKELIKLDSHKVRGNSSLMTVYIEAFTKQFGYAPSCVGCTFGNDFAKLIRAVRDTNLPTIQKKMEDKTFDLKIQGKILAYRKDGKTFRVYDNKVTEAFAVNFLTHGTEEEIKERKKLFRNLPDAIAKSSASKAKTHNEDEAAADVNQGANQIRVTSEEVKTVQEADVNATESPVEKTATVKPVKKTRKKRTPRK